MDPRALKLLDAARHALGLDRPVHPWGLGLVDGQIREVERTPLPVVFEPVLAPAVPLPYDLDPQQLLAAFSPEQHPSIEQQIERSYNDLYVLTDQRPAELDPEAVVKVTLGVPLFAGDLVLLRLRTENLYRDLRGEPQLVHSEFFAWLTTDGQRASQLNREQRALIAGRAGWVPGRSPGLPATPT